MRNTPGLWSEFDQTVREWASKGYATIRKHEKGGPGFFIPTFMVVREDKASTKFRLIVNGKFEFKQKSINHFLLSGPNVMNRLQDVLIRFRYHKYVVTCDVANMFLRVKVPEKDQKYLRFFFRDSAGEIKVVQMSSHAFGLTQSPFVVIHAVQTQAKVSSILREGSRKAVLEDSIVDDILTGCKTFQQLEEMRKEISGFYESINMQVHKWATNSPTLRDGLKPEERASSVNLGADAEELFCSTDEEIPSIKCLGVLWHPETDMLQFFHEKEPDAVKWTMRKISSWTSRLFDPLGLMCPLLLEGKLVMQSLWRLGLSWDDPVPPEVARRYSLWLRRAETSHLSHIARRVKPPYRSLEEKLIIFTDASSQAQAAVAYLYCRGQDRCSGRLWAARQKISSLNKSETISRLELEGAVMGVELARSICKAMRWDMSSVLYYTDSTTVLWWLRTHKELDVFVGNRVCRILDHSGASQWFHVNTKSNPADLPTRGLSGRLLAKSALWWEGPSFFSRPRGSWPAQPPVVETRECADGYRKEEKRRVEHWLCLNRGEEAGRDPRSGLLDAFWLDLVCQNNNLERGLGVAAQVYSFLGKFTRFNWETNTRLARRGVQVLVVRAAQSAGLPDLLRSVVNGTKVPKEFKDLNPMLDSSGLLRLGGRLQYSTRLPMAVRCPLILNGKHFYARRFLENIHENELRHCGGRRTLMAESRWKAWVSGLARLARKVTRSCTHCSRSCKVRPIKIDEAPLHYTRLPLAKGCAFSEIGIDMAGPFYVKLGRGRTVGKRFVLLFSCCWTRALSLEVMDSASTESCVSAFLRHCNVFGYPSYVNSDRGTNLVGLDRHYKEQWSVLESAFNQHKIRWPEIEWNFNPPYSPRFTGHVEIMVKITKNSLRKVLGQPQYLFQEEELRTLIKVVQGYSNRRPLSEPSDDPNDPPPLVPADFLLTGSRFLGGIPELQFENYSLKTRKEMLGKVTREMWHALTSEFILELQRFERERGGKTLKVGDLVFLLDKTLPSGKYCIGRIKSEFTNPDGKARSFLIEHRGQTLKRSLMTLAPFFVENQNDPENVDEKWQH